METRSVTCEISDSCNNEYKDYCLWVVVPCSLVNIYDDFDEDDILIVITRSIERDRQTRPIFTAFWYGNPV
jgi:hypothetical protein